MLRNEKGSALLTVMLMMLIFTILGLSIMSATIGGAKRAEVRETQIETDLASIKSINEGIAYIKAIIDSQYSSSTSIEEYNQQIIPSIFSNIPDNAGFTIENVTGLYNASEEDGGIGIIDIEHDFTRVFDVSANSYSGEVYKQRLYVTAMPSFLKYALGSKENLTMNGSIHIEYGNIYARKNLYLSNQARYIFGDQKLVQTDYSSTNKNTILEVYQNINYCHHSTSNRGNDIPLGSGGACYQYEAVEENGTVEDSNGRTVWNQLKHNEINQEEIKKLFQSDHSPTYLLPNEEFVDVNIPGTIIDKLSEINVSAGYKMDENKIKFGSLNAVNEVNDTDDENDYIDTSMANENRNNYIADDSVYIEANKPVENLFTIKKGNWLIVDGNALIENIGSAKLNIDANIIVTGNLLIKGNVAFNSTIYVLGNVDVNDANIEGYKYTNNRGDEIYGDLILMNEKELSIAKINKFTDPKSSDYNLNVYFYTASDAELYAVGSFIRVTGGLFAGGNLEVNSFRGKTSPPLNFEASDDIEDSRLTISNTKRLFLNQSQGLPRVDKLDYSTEPIKKRSK